MPAKRRVAVMLELNWPYKRHAGIFVGSQVYAQEKGWESIIDEYADDTLRRCSKKTVPYDGIIARGTNKLLLQTRRLKVPLVNVWYSSPIWEKSPGVFPNYLATGRLRAEHLLSRGLRRFAGLIHDNNRSQKNEITAFAETVARAGFPCAATTVSLEATSSVKLWREAERKIRAWMSEWEPPVGVYVGAEFYGRMLIPMCRSRGWRVPEDVAIIAGDNEETFCEYLHPTLTSVEFGYERIGYEAARLLDSLMDGKEPAEKHTFIPAQGLVVRESTDFFAVDDELTAAALRFIATHCHQEIGADDVSRAVSSETRTLQRRFSKHLKRPIATVIRLIRMERAKRELAQSDRRLSEIARDAGFGKSIRMYEVFKRELGVTPSDYRRDRQLKR